VIAVNRGPQYAAPFHFTEGNRPEPRPLSFDGKTITPLEAGIHPVEKGPVGEGFTSALVRAHPEMAPSVANTPGYRATYPAFGGTRTYGPAGAGAEHSAGSTAPHVSASSGASHPSSGGGGGGGASHATSSSSSSSSSSPHH
jgi:hypothetical protein